METTRRLTPLLGLLTAATLAAGCVRGTRTVDLPVRGGGQGPDAPPGATARVRIPERWQPLVPSASRVEFLDPETRARAYLRAMPAQADAAGCPALAKKYAAEVIESWGGPPRTRLAHQEAHGDSVDFELRRQDPQPQGEIIWARVVCRHGTLAIASCTVPTPRERELTSLCRRVLGSLEVRPPERTS